MECESRASNAENQWNRIMIPKNPWGTACFGLRACVNLRVLSSTSCGFGLPNGNNHNIHA
eukprot:6622077-Lingulodinium_polyedra.AAC.1